MARKFTKLRRRAVERPRGDLNQWRGAFLEYLKSECHLAANTIAAYARDLRRFEQWLQGRRPADLTMADFSDYAAKLHELRLSPPSIARHLVSLKIFCRYLQLEGVLRENLAELLGSQKLWYRVPNVLSAEQVDRFLAAPGKQDSLYLRDRALLQLLYATGCRVSEISHLKVGDVRFAERSCICHGKGDKQRIVPLHAAALDALTTYLRELRPQLARALGDSHDWLLLSRSGRRLRREAIWELVKKYIRRTDISPDVSPHTLRHTFATHMLAGGADLRQVQELLGHANITTTQIYTHVDSTRLKQVHRKYHPRA